MAQPFQVVAEIGRGAMGAVYEVRVPGLDRRVAAKVLVHPASDAHARFLREGEVTARLQHPNIARVHSAGVCNGHPYLLFDFVEGGTLREVFEREAPLGEARALDLLTPVAEALAYAHAHEIVHRDVKPQNVLVTQDGRPILTDFGIAKALDLERLTLTNAIVGTPAYMAPEQRQPGRPMGPPTDVYAFGLLLYEALTGELPYGERKDPRGRAPAVSKGLARLVSRCLAEDPAARYPDCGALLADLRRGGASGSILPWLVAPLTVLVLGAALGALRLGGAAPTPTSTIVRPRATQSAPRPPAWPRRFDLELGVGDVFVVRFTRSVKVPREGQKRKWQAVGVPLPPAMEWTVRHRVLERDGDRARIEGEIVAARILEPGGEVAFDSADPSLGKERFRAFEKVIGARYAFEQELDTGYVTTLTGGEAIVQALVREGYPDVHRTWLSDSSLRSFLARLCSFLPEQAIEQRTPSWNARTSTKGLPLPCLPLEVSPDTLVATADQSWSHPDDVAHPDRARCRWEWQQGLLRRASVEHWYGDVEHLPRTHHLYTCELIEVQRKQ